MLMFPRKMPIKPIIALSFVAAAITCALFFDVKQILARGQVELWQQHSPLTTAALFALLYLFVAGFSLPGTGPLTFVAGALFGVWQGVLLVSLVSALGATIGMLMSRWLLRSWVEKQYQSVLEKVNAGLARDGKLYLFSLRLIPPMPFFIVNLVFGVTHMRARTFFWVSQLGMLPLILVYVNAGANLGELDELSWSALFTSKLIVALLLLLLIPMLARYWMNWLQQRKA